MEAPAADVDVATPPHLTDVAAAGLGAGLGHPPSQLCVAVEPPLGRHGAAEPDQPVQSAVEVGQPHPCGECLPGVVGPLRAHVRHDSAGRHYSSVFYFLYTKNRTNPELWAVSWPNQRTKVFRTGLVLGEAPTATEDREGRMDAGKVLNCDPAEEAPPIVTGRNPKADSVGHGRILPLVGGVRPYVFDVTYNGGTERVYADTPAGVLTALIDGYDSLWEDWKTASAALTDAEERGETPTATQQAAAEDAYYLLVTARIRYATNIRRQLQQAENIAAQTTGTWDQLSSEERAQCTESAAGAAPIGVLVEAPWDPDDLTDGADTIEFGVWETPHCRLVINRGDYGVFDLDGTPEPQSTLSETDPETGEQIVYVTEQPENMLILDPTDDWGLLQSLEHAALISIETRPVDLPDQFYTDAVTLGREILAGGTE